MTDKKEKKDILLIDPYPNLVNSVYGKVDSLNLKKLLEERTEGNVWVAEFDKDRRTIKRLEHPKGRECTTTENDKWVRYSKSLYMEGDSSLLEPNFKLIQLFGAVVEVARNCPQEDTLIMREEPVLTIPPVAIIGSCNCMPSRNGKFNTALYTLSYREKELEHCYVSNFKGNRISPIRGIEDIADFVTGMLLNDEAIQERAIKRFKKLKADYETLTKRWEK